VVVECWNENETGGGGGGKAMTGFKVISDLQELSVEMFDGEPAARYRRATIYIIYRMRSDVT
jgi:hypothetical protein